MKMPLIVFIMLFFSSMIAWSDDSINIACPGGILPNDSLMKVTRRNVREGIETTINYSVEKAKCYKVTEAKFVYLIDKKHAVYSIRLNHDRWPYSEPQMFLFVHQDSAQWRRISGVIKGTGEMVNYKDGEGIPRSMPKMIVVQEKNFDRH